MDTNNRKTCPEIIVIGNKTEDLSFPFWIKKSIGSTLWPTLLPIAFERLGSEIGHTPTKHLVAVSGLNYYDTYRISSSKCQVPNIIKVMPNIFISFLSLVFFFFLFRVGRMLRLTPTSMLTDHSWQGSNHMRCLGLNYLH